MFQHWCRIAVPLSAAAICSLSILSAHSAVAREYRLRPLYSFCSDPGCADGGEPVSGLVSDASGNLFGTTSSGAHGAGTAFRLVPEPGGHRYHFRTIYSFCALNGCLDGNGAVPGVPLIIDRQGNLYGVAELGGSSGFGVAFELP